LLLLLQAAAQVSTLHPWFSEKCVLLDFPNIRHFSELPIHYCWSWRDISRNWGRLCLQPSEIVWLLHPEYN